MRVFGLVVNPSFNTHMLGLSHRRYREDVRMTVSSVYLDERTRHFSGRGWVFDAVNAWLSSETGSRVFLLTGGPGTGKSAIAARLAQMNLGQVAAPHPALGRDSLTYVHFCQTGVEDTLSPVTFVQSLSEALANRFPVFRQALEKSGSRQIVINAVQTIGTLEAGAQAIAAKIGQISITIKGGDARPLFDDAVRRPLKELAGGLGAGERVVILVDSLDEALGFNADNNIVQLLGVAADFPASVRFILTCRSNSDRVFEIVGPSSLDLIGDAPRSLDEVTPYVAARLQGVPEPERSVAASRIAAKSEGNFLYAHHVVEDLLSRGGGIADADTLDLPATLEGVYRQSLERGLASSRTRWNDVYRPILGAIAVARGDGLTKEQLVEITDLADDTASDVLGVCAQFLLGGGGARYRIYHQSFREFLLDDEKFTVFPAERHAAIARYLQDRCGASWNRCTDDYALRYAAAHWADAAALSPTKRDVRTHALIALTADPRYQQRFEARISDLPLLHAHVHRAVQVASLNERDDMLPSIVKAAKTFVAFRREYLRSESLVSLAESGRFALAEARLPLFADVGEDWQAIARVVLAWLAAERNPGAATEVRDSMVAASAGTGPMPLLLARMSAALNGVQEFSAAKGMAPSLEIGQQLVKRISGQDFNRELLSAINPSLMAPVAMQPEMVTRQGFASNFDAPMLVHLARESGAEGTMLVDEYIDAHAGYNYVEYRNKSLWYVLTAVLRHHGGQQWVKTRLRRLLVAALSGGGVDFEEMLPLTSAVVLDRARGGGTSVLDAFEQRALQAANTLQDRRGANDSWGSHRRRLTVLMELSHLLLGDASRASRLFQRNTVLPDGFAGFQAPARLRVADALRACRMEQGGALDQTLELALRSAHHIQDYHFCARVTARCNALTRWHRRALAGADLAAAIGRLSRSPNDVEFAADHVVGMEYAFRPKTPDMLPVAEATDAATLEQLGDVFQRSSVEFRRLNPTHAVSEALSPGTLVHVPDPGFAPLLAVHLAARAMADDSIADQRVALVRTLAPVAAINPTALDTVLSYFVVAADLQDPGLLEEIAEEAGPVILTDTVAPAAQIGPDAVLPA